jgi:ABC-type glycerol-3-phosphate transport system substrate-binding protein
MRKNVWLLAVLAGIALLAGCGNKQAPSTGSSAEAVTLVFSLEEHPDETADAFVQSLLEEYTKLTGTKIDYKPIPFSDYRTWLTTQFTAGTGPAVHTSILHDATTDYNKGWAYNFHDLYEQASKYDPGKPWKNTLPESILERMYINPQRDVPGYPTSTSIVRIFCNTDLFKAAGAALPKTWAEFMDACARLKQNGVIPIAFPNATIADLSWGWFNNSVSSQLNNPLLAKVDVSGNGYAELNELCRAFDQGIWNFNTPELKTGFQLMKNFSQYWTTDFNSLNRSTAMEMFLRGEVAMIQALSGELRMIDEMTEGLFSYAVIPVPVITKATSPYAQEKSVVLGGQPDTIYSIDASLGGAGLEAAVDFVQWMASPDVQARLAVEIYRIPLATSVKLPEKLSGFIMTEEPLRLNYYFGINEQIRNYFYRAGQQYLEGRITLDAMCDTLNRSYKEVLGGIMAENRWTSDNNYGMTAQ